MFRAATSRFECSHRRTWDADKVDDIAQVVTAYAPVACGAFGMLKDPAHANIAERRGKTRGQVVLRWHVQSGRTALPKTSKVERMAENRDIYDFALSDREMRAIDALGAGEARRTCPDPSTIA